MKLGLKILHRLIMKGTISTQKLREFGLLIGLGFPLIIGWLIPAFIGHGFREWTLWIGIFGLTFGIISPNILYYPYKGWMAIGYILGWFNIKIILGFVFIFVLQPIAFFMYIFGYDPLRKIRKGKESYRQNKEQKPIDLNRIF